VTVLLRLIDDEILERLLDVAVTEAEPIEVMPPVDGPGTWTEPRVAAFRAFHRARYGGLDGPHRTAMFAVVADGAVVA
jgi:hypothetical protein